jgi:hypothetical protein
MSRVITELEEAITVLQLKYDLPLVDFPDYTHRLAALNNVLDSLRQK